jgi:hypothetical protein
MEWRDAVLPRAGDLQSPSVASATTADGGCKPPARASQLSTFNPQPAPWWQEWLWPCPQAWAALAAVWVLLLAVNFSNRDRSAPSTASAKTLPVMPYAWREQEKLLAELFPPEPAVPPPTRTHSPPALPAAPRSELRHMRSREGEIA